MARKFKRDDITEPGLYEIRLNDGDYCFVGKFMAIVIASDPNGILIFQKVMSKDVPAIMKEIDPRSWRLVSDIEDDYWVYQRKIKDVYFETNMGEL